MITEGKMQYLYDEKGRRYLDVSRSRGSGVGVSSACCAQLIRCMRHAPAHRLLHKRIISAFCKQ